MRTSTILGERFSSDHHAITVEISPPKGTDYHLFLERVKPLVDLADAINVPDCQRSILKMSSLAAAKLIQDEVGMETVWQVTGRDRNIIALQADLLGGWALGMRHVLVLTGDPVQIGDQADVAKTVSHLDSLRLLELIRQLNDGKDATTKPLKKQGTRFIYGAALNPHRMSRQAQIHRLQYKLSLGLDFFQTQPLYDRTTWLETRQVIVQLCDKLNRPVPKLLVGIIPPKSAEFARFMNQHILGIHIPQSFIDQLERSSTPIEDSVAFCADLMIALADCCDGFHVMPVGIEKAAPKLLERVVTQSVIRRPVLSTASPLLSG